MILKLGVQIGKGMWFRRKEHSNLRLVEPADVDEEVPENSSPLLPSLPPGF
jgi:hypothetical protein